jgi:hypothetical protein
MPVRNSGPSIPDIVIDELVERAYLGGRRHDVAARVAERQQEGIRRYGTPLQAHNGRDALRDLDDEIVDAIQYARQAMAERDHNRPDDPDLPRLRALYDDLLHMACAVADMRDTAGRPG